MTALVSAKNQALLGRMQTRLSRRAADHIAKVQRQAKAARDRTVASEAKRRRKQEAEKERVRRKIAKRMPLARLGLERLRAVGQSRTVQKIIADLREVNTFDDLLYFYSATRYSGEAFEMSDRELKNAGFIPATRDVVFALCENYVQISSGAFAYGDVMTWKIYYRPESAEQAVSREYPPSPGQYVTVEHFLQEIAIPETVNMAVVARPCQRTLEWEPDDVVFQALVNCGNRRMFHRYLTKLRI